MQNSKLLKNRAYKFSLNLIEFMSGLQDNRTTRIIGNQLLRSGTSIGANLFEARGASSKKDFVNYYQIALKSANETKYWLCLLRDAKVDKEIKLEKLLNEVKEIANMIGASVLTLKGKKR